MKNKFLYLLVLLGSAIILKFGIGPFLEHEYSTAINLVAVGVILVVGVVFTLRGTANIIEETTEVLHERTKLAGGLLQSLGTAFPDMVLGVVAALMSLSVVATDRALAINYAIIAAATTFGSNIYNILHATWCVYRQNLANKLGKNLLMFPKIPAGGTVRPMADHKLKPTLKEFDNSIEVLTALTLLTSLVAMSMVIFGKVPNRPEAIQEDLYQLIQPIGFVIFAMAVSVLFYFRQGDTERKPLATDELLEEGKYYHHQSNAVIWANLALAGIAILLAAETMVHAIQVFCEITEIPFVVAGILAGVIGCLGEMIVVHNFSVNPNGRMGDAIVGVAMDNIVTISGACIVAMMGGIFLGGNSLILIFVIVLAANTVLIWQISKLKNFLIEKVR